MQPIRAKINCFKRLGGARRDCSSELKKCYKNELAKGIEMLDPREAFFHNEYSARQYIENVRWPDGPACIRCQSKNVIRMGGRTQPGMFLCRECRNKFSCRMGTAMEHSHVPLHKWLLALLLVTPSGGYLSPQKLKLQLGLGSYRTAWLMTQRIRDALWRHRRELERQGCRPDLMSC